jgi:transcriptional regulator with XRE-family HTH domain
VTITSSLPSGSRPIGDLLREWRQRRRLSQLDLAIEADISARHLSFVETGRSRPTSQMILRLAEHLEVPLRERNTCCWRAVTRLPIRSAASTSPTLAPSARPWARS